MQAVFGTDNTDITGNTWSFWTIMVIELTFYVQPWNRTMRDVYRGLLVLVFHVVKVKVSKTCKNGGFYLH